MLLKDNIEQDEMIQNQQPKKFHFLLKSLFLQKL